MPDPELSDIDLFQMLRHDNVRAFEILYNKYWYDLYLLAAAKTGRSDIGQELSQQLFENLWKKRKELQISNVRNYLYAALKNLVIDHIRRHIQEEKYLVHLHNYLSGSQVHGIADLEYEELSRTVENELKKLPEKTQYIYHLSRNEMRTVAEIAQEMHLSEKTIEYHITKALSHLRTSLSRYLPYLIILEII